jgi:hypothetical protein
MRCEFNIEAISRGNPGAKSHHEFQMIRGAPGLWSGMASAGWNATALWL